MKPTTINSPASSPFAAQLKAIGDRQDRAAFAALFRHFAPRLKSYLLRLTGDPAAAEELMQETMVNVWRKAGQYDPAKANPSTWIFTIARNVRIDLYRREKRPEIDPNDPMLVPDAEMQPEETIVRHQSAAALTRAIAVLSDGERSVLHLSYFENLSHSVIAKRLGLPLGTVKSRLRLAFGKLREALGAT